MGFEKVERAVLIFIDGLGVGEEDEDRNPMARVRGPCLSVFSGDGVPEILRQGISKPLDACLGMEGLPQSATGQTALLTGVNAAELLGHHLFGFPNRRLQEIIMERSLLKRAVDAGLTAAFLNVFRPRFFELDDSIWEKYGLSVTTWVNHAAGLPFFKLEDIVARRAIYQEFTNHALREKGFEVPLFTPEEAGSILAERSRDFDLLLYEYFRTDEVGHSREMTRGIEEVGRLEVFLESFLHHVDLSGTLVILSSDHGNIEDLSVRTHTRNPAMTILWGDGAGVAAQRLQSITDVPGILLQAMMG
jgi:hypothetical protein